MEWQCDRPENGGKKHEEDAQGLKANATFKSMYCRSFRSCSNGNVTRPHRQQFSEERIANGKEPVEGACTKVHPSSQGHRLKKHLHPRAKPYKQMLKENELEQKRAGAVRGRTASDAADAGGHTQMCKQQNSRENHGSNLRHQQDIPSQQTRSPNQPLSTKRRGPRPFSEKGMVEQCTRTTLKRNPDSETSPQPNRLTGKGIKRSRRVAQRLAHEEPPPPPLKLPKLHLVLTRKEIQEDWIKITGHKYTGKPRKSTLVQKGLGLCTALTCPASIEYLNEPHCKTLINFQQ